MPKLVDRISLQGSPRTPESGFLIPSLSPHTPAPPPEVSTRIKNLPAKPDLPLTKRSLRDRISCPYTPTPLLDRIDLKFTRKKELQVAILDKRVAASIKRLQAIFDRKTQLESLTPDQRRALDHLADRIEFISDHSDVIVDKFSASSRFQIEYILTALGRISFAQLKLRYKEVVKQLLDIQFTDNWADRFTLTYDL